MNSHRFFAFLLLLGVNVTGCSRDSGDLQPAQTQVQPSSPAILGTPDSSTRFDLSDETLYSPVPSSVDPGGLVIAGDNSSDVIRDLTSINGLSIPELEQLMRPRNKDKRSSVAGFLGADESLIDLLVEDNDFVHSLGLTHRELAIPLLQLFRKALGNRKESPPGSNQYIANFSHAGINWSVKMQFWDGLQHSPFNDETSASSDYVITNVDNGHILNVPELVPTMIERYGFYEGHGTNYRVSPQDIVALLGINADRKGGK